MTDHLKKVEMNYQTSCSIICNELKYRFQYKGSGEKKNQPKNPTQTPNT